MKNVIHTILICGIFVVLLVLILIVELCVQYMACSPILEARHLLVDGDFISSSMHCFEGPEWLHLKRGRESFARGPLVKADPQGRCSGVLVYGLQMIILKAAQVSFASCSFDYFIVYFSISNGTMKNLFMCRPVGRKL